MGLVMAPDNPVLDSNLARVGLEQGGQATNGRAFSCAIGPKSESDPVGTSKETSWTALTGPYDLLRP